MIPEVIIAAVLLGWALKGKFGRLADVKIRYVWVVFVVLGVSWVVGQLSQHNVFAFLSTPYRVNKIASFVLLSGVAAMNIRIAGVKLMLAGLLGNLAAIAFNGGIMPVSRAGVEAISGKSLSEALVQYPFVQQMLIGPTTKLAFLCDKHIAHPPYALFTRAYSLGDIVTSAGCFIAIIAIMRSPLPAESKPIAEEA